MSAALPVLQVIDDLDPSWLERALGRPVAGFETERIGTGQMSQNHRVTLDDGSTVVLKLAATDENSRATGVGLGAYEREVRFYNELAPRIGAAALSPCHAAVLDPEQGWFTIVLGDAAPAVQGDQIAGCTVEEARRALRALAEIQAPVFGDPELGATPWLNQEMPLNQAVVTQLLGGFLERYGDRVGAEHRAVTERFVASLDGWVADRRPPLGLVHGDYRLDNMLFGAGGDSRVTVVDWQTVGWGAAMTDAAYFLGSGLTTEDRRAHEEDLVREYHGHLQELGVQGFSWDECWTGYRRQCFLGILMVVAPAMLVERTERGDDMFMVSLERFAQQAIDLDAADLLPEPGSGRPAPLRPEPDDEGRHAPGTEPLWNESWYFDAVSDDGATGVYARLGLYPNLGVSWVTAFVCGSERETVAVIDFAAPLPAPDAPLAAGALTLECEAALERYRVRLEGTGEAHADAAAFLRGEEGAAQPVAFDLTWETLGEPYAYRVATRYEIPCEVRGTVRVGGEEIALRGVGQRDHSWGARDWWSAEWVWCAGHLDDGTRFHGVEFRLPDTPPLGLGYLQPPEGGVEEVDAVTAAEDVGSDGLITSGRLTFGELSLEVAPTAFGPLRLEAPDGRVSQFPRAMCRFTAPDGRTGVGWVEWNRNRSLG